MNKNAIINTTKKEKRFLIMKITIYLNPNTLQVLDEEHFQQIVANHTEKACEDPKTFRDWLSQNFGVDRIFYMDESDKRQTRAEYNSYCYKSAKKSLLQRYEKREVEI